MGTRSASFAKKNKSTSVQNLGLYLKYNACAVIMFKVSSFRVQITRSGQLSLKKQLINTSVQ